ncbi:MAG: saccharopine dehydrogenase [Pseudomonadota bacterium]
MTLTIWLRAEEKPFERRTPCVPGDAAKLVSAGMRVVVERSGQRAIPAEDYEAVGCELAEEGSWPEAPDHAFILGLKELPEDTHRLRHRHIHFAHIFKGQPGAEHMLKRFKGEGGQLFDLECLVDEMGRRIAAFGHWAGYAGAAVAVAAWCGQQQGAEPPLGALKDHDSRDDLVNELKRALAGVGANQPNAIVIGALGRSGRGAVSLLEELGLEATKWDMAETRSGGPFPEIMGHDLFINCVLLAPGCPPFVTNDMIAAGDRRLSVISDVSCDPGSPHNPLPIYEACTDFANPTTRVSAGPPPLDLIAIDHLPSMLPLESSEDYSSQLIDALLALDKPDEGVWARALGEYTKHINSV